mgnify:CR=1 FL=1
MGYSVVGWKKNAGARSQDGRETGKGCPPMKEYTVVKLREQPQLLGAASLWFHQKWGIPQAVYAASMADCLQRGGIPLCYLVLDGDTLVAGAGVIANDFHLRRDLSPNVCAVYVEEAYRRRGIAKAMLDFVCRDLRDMGLATLYLLTDHTSFYEHCGWRFLCMVQGDGEEEMSRMYVKESGFGG